MGDFELYSVSSSSPARRSALHKHTLLLSLEFMRTGLSYADALASLDHPLAWFHPPPTSIRPASCSPGLLFDPPERESGSSPRSANCGLRGRLTGPRVRRGRDVDWPPVP